MKKSAFLANFMTRCKTAPPGGSRTDKLSQISEQRGRTIACRHAAARRIFWGERSEFRMFSQNAKDYLCEFYRILERMIQGMTGAELTDSISRNFIVQMIPHHEAAIEMSQSLLRYTTFTPLRQIACGIVEEQTKSIADMRAALEACGGLLSPEQDLCLYQRRFQQITGRMFRRMDDAPASNNLNVDFMREMIPHHEGAIQMSENALCFPICPELKPILRAIIVSQRKGVRKMERLLRACCQPSPASGTARRR